MLGHLSSFTTYPTITFSESHRVGDVWDTSPKHKFLNLVIDQSIVFPLNMLPSKSLAWHLGSGWVVAGGGFPVRGRRRLLRDGLQQTRQRPSRRGHQVSLRNGQTQAIHQKGEIGLAARYFSASFLCAGIF